MRVTLGNVRDALEKRTVVPVYQPQIGLRTSKLTGFEVLARWEHPKRGLILPENFIQLAEEAGLIGRLTEVLLEQAFSVASKLPESLSLSVNVSPIQLHQPGLPKIIREAAERANFSLRRLTIEVTETALLTRPEEASAVAQELKELGCRLALDDFGTGYSSLSHLQALPFDELKVDRSFVASMLVSRQSRKIVAAVIGLGQSLGLTTVAEGVETKDQADMLSWLGCDQGQGWLYGQPVGGDEVEAIVAARRGAAPVPAPQLEDSFALSLEVMPWQGLAHLRALYRNTSVGLCFLDRRLRYVSMNHRYAELNGLSIPEALGQPVQDLLPDIYPHVEPLLQRALQGESIENKEVSRPTRGVESGDELSLLLSYQPVSDEGGELIGISVSVVDITECKRIEALLQEAERHYQLMVDLNPQTPWILDAEGNALDVGSQWMEMTGLSIAQSRRVGWLDALHPDDVPRAMAVVRESVQTGKPMDVEYRVWDRHRNDWHWLRARGTPRFGPGGQILYWYGNFEDIDERKRQEARTQAGGLKQRTSGSH